MRKFSRVSWTIGVIALAALTLLWIVRPRKERPTPAPESLQPRVEVVNHLGVRRGFATDLVIRGSSLSGHPRLVAPFRFFALDANPGKSNAGEFLTRITVDPATPLGVYPVRVLTDEGLSAPFTLAVGQLPQIRGNDVKDSPRDGKDEPDFETSAQEIALPTVVEGEIIWKSGRSNGDFRFRGTKGQRIFAGVQGASLGSGVDADSSVVSLDREDKFHTHGGILLTSEPPLFATLPRDGDFFFFVSDNHLRRIDHGHHIKDEPRTYRLTIGALPAAAEVYPLGGRRGETIQVQMSGGTLDAPMTVPITLSPLPGETIVRLRAGTALRGPDGAMLEIESLPPLVVSDLPEVLARARTDLPPPKAKPPVVLNGWIDEERQDDRFTLIVSPGQRLRAICAAQSLGSPVHISNLKVYDSRAREVVTSSVLRVYPRVAGETWDRFIVPARGGVPEHVTLDPAIEFDVPEGETEVTLTVHGYRGRDPLPFRWIRELSGPAYRITVQPVVPGFSIDLDDAQVSLPRGGTAAVGVTVVRDGFDGPITLGLADPPAGLAFRPGFIAAGKSAGVFTLEAAPDATFDARFLDVIGEGLGPNGPITVHAGKVLSFGSLTTEPQKIHADTHLYIFVPAFLRTRLQTQVGLLAATTKALPMRLDTPSETIDVKRGEEKTFRVSLGRKEGSVRSVILGPKGEAPGFSIPPMEIDDGAEEATVRVVVAPQQPLGPVTIVLEATGMVGGERRQFIAPAVTLRVGQ